MPFGLGEQPSVGSPFADIGRGPFGSLFGRAKDPTDIAPFLPTEDQIATKRQEIRESKPWWVELLEVPGELLFQQSILGFMGGDGSEGAQDNIVRGLRNNPIFQLIDYLPGVDGLTDNLEFSDVRELGGLDFLGLGGSHAEVNEGLGNFAINLIGSMVTSPLEMVFLPYGKVATTGVKAGRFLSKVNLLSQAAKVRPGLSAAVKAGERAMFLFKVPFTKTGYAVHSFANLDFKATQVIESAAEFLNALPGVAAARKAVSTTYISAKNVVNKVTGETRSAAAQRATVEAAEEARQNPRALVQPWMDRMSWLLSKSPQMFQDEPSAKLIYAFAEQGPVALDTAVSLRAMLEEGGRSYASSQAKMAGIIEKGGADAKLLMEARSGDSAALVAWFQKHPDISVWQDSHFKQSDLTEMLATAGLSPRLGVDVRGDPRVFDFTPGGTPDSSIARTMARPPGGSVDVLGVRIPFRPKADDVGSFVDRANLAEEAAGGTKAAIAGATAEKLELYDRLLKANGPQYIEELGNIAREGNALMREVGRKDEIDGLIDMVSSPYIMRIVDPKVKQLINDTIGRALETRTSAEGLSVVRSFMRGRTFDQLDSLEANWIVREVGTRYTGQQPLKHIVDAFARDKVEGVNAWLADVFESAGVLDKLRAMKGPDAKVAYDMIAASPHLSWIRRISDTLSVRQDMEFNKSLLDDGSALVFHRSALKDADTLESTLRLSSPDNDWQRPLVAYIRDKTTGSASVMSTSRLIRSVLGVDQAAKRHMAEISIANSLDDAAMEAHNSVTDIASRIYRYMDPKDPGRFVVDAADPAYLRTLKQNRVSLADTRQSLKDVNAQILDIKKRFGKVNRKFTASQKARLEELGNSRTSILARERALLTKVQDVEAGLSKWHSGVTQGRMDIEGLKDLSRKAAADSMKAATDLSQASRSGAMDMIEIMRMHKKHGVLALDELRGKHPDLYAKLVKSSPDAEVVWLDADIAKELYGKNGVIDRMRSPDNWSHTFRVLDGFNAWWKQWTLWFPQTAARNFVTSHVMTLMSGTPFHRWAQAAPKAIGATRAIRKAMDTGDLSAISQWSIKRADGAVLGGEELYRQAFKVGALNASYVGETMLERTSDAVMKARGLAGMAEARASGFVKRLFAGALPWKASDGVKNPILKASWKVQEATDQHGRLTGIIARWLDGDSLEDSSRHIMAYHYNAGKSRTLIERQAFTRFIPFWNWTKFASSTVVRAYMQNPSGAAFWGRLWKSAHDANGIKFGDWDQILPEYVNTMFGVPFQQTEQGPSYFLMGNYLPHGEIMSIASAISRIGETNGLSLVNNIGGRITPAIAKIAETVTNYSFFTGREIENFDGEHDEMFGVSMPRKARNLVQAIRFLNELDRTNLLSFADVDGIRLKVSLELNANPRAGVLGERAQISNPFVRAASGAFGVLPRGHQVSVEDEARYTRGRLEREESRLKGFIRKRLMEGDRTDNKEDLPVLQEQLAIVMAKQRALAEIPGAEEPEAKRRRQTIGGSPFRRFGGRQ